MSADSDIYDDDKTLAWLTTSPDMLAGSLGVVGAAGDLEAGDSRDEKTSDNALNPASRPEAAVSARPGGPGLIF